MYWYPMTDLPTRTTKTTIELRELVENSVDIWDFDYPSFYQGAEKKAFENKVIEHYYLRQIGFETVGRFKHQFRVKIREIMPYYVQLYKTEQQFYAIEDPFESYHLTETLTKTTTTESEAASSGTSSEEHSDDSNTSESATVTGEKETVDRFSNTPQGQISNIDTYMTEARKVQEETSEGSEKTGSVKTDGNSSSTSEGTTTGSATGTEDYTLERWGNIGVQPLGDEIQKLRAALLNIDKMIIDELNCLFLGIY